MNWMVKFLISLTIVLYTTATLQADGELDALEKQVVGAAETQQTMDKFHLIASVGALLALGLTANFYPENQESLLTISLAWLGLELGFYQIKSKFINLIKTPLENRLKIKAEEVVRSLNQQIKMLPADIKHEIEIYKNDIIRKHVKLDGIPAEQIAALENILAFVSWGNRSPSAPKLINQYYARPTGRKHIERILADLLMIEKLFEKHSEKIVGHKVDFRLHLIVGSCRSVFESGIRN